ncbi:MAG: SIMPL domain-containing protein, partial [Pleurocapsa sp.]
MSHNLLRSHILGTLVIYSCFSLILTNPAIAEEKLSTLIVTGQGIEMIATTLAQVRLGVEIQGKTAAEVQQEVARRSSAVVELLRTKNVAGLQTTG